MSKSKNGDSAEAIQRERERQRNHQQAMAGLKFDDDGALSREYLESLIDTTVLQDETTHLIRYYLDRNWMLSNLTDAEAHDQRWKLEVVKYKLLGMHPPQESVVEGPLRAFLWDEETASLGSLSPPERVEIEALIDSLKTIVTRSRDGFEREQLVTQVRESRTGTGVSTTEESQGAFTGLFE